MRTATIILRIILWGYFIFHTGQCCLWFYHAPLGDPNKDAYSKAFHRDFWRAVKAGACIIALGFLK